MYIEKNATTHFKREVAACIYAHLWPPRMWEIIPTGYSFPYYFEEVANYGGGSGSRFKTRSCFGA